MVKRKVVWDELARAALRAVYSHIKKDSPKQAEKVKQEIILWPSGLLLPPEMHPQDKYRKDKDVRFRSFEKHNYRVSYFIADDAIRVLRLRHVKQEPKEYWVHPPGLTGDDRLCDWVFSLEQSGQTSPIYFLSRGQYHQLINSQPTYYP